MERSSLQNRVSKLRPKKICEIDTWTNFTEQGKMAGAMVVECAGDLTFDHRDNVRGDILSIYPPRIVGDPIFLLR
jgi:hypothetical protein